MEVGIDEEGGGGNSKEHTRVRVKKGSGAIRNYAVSACTHDTDHHVDNTAHYTRAHRVERLLRCRRSFSRDRSVK